MNTCSHVKNALNEVFSVLLLNVRSHAKHVCDLKLNLGRFPENVISFIETQLLLE